MGESVISSDEYFIHVVPNSRCIGTPPPSWFQKEAMFVNYYRLIWRTKSSQNEVYSFRNEFAPMEANSSLYQIIPVYMGGNNENDVVASPEVVLIRLKRNT